MYFFGGSSATALAAVALMGATLGIPTEPVRSASRAMPVSPESVQMPVFLAAAINTSPTTLGVADSALYNLSEAEVNKTLDELGALGVHDVRIAVPWAYVQPYSAQTYDWAKLDAIVNAATSRDMGVLGVISATPAWAGPILNGHPDPDDFAAFASAVATRYSGKISAYELWNEPNGVIFYSPVSPEDYTDLLKAAYPAIKAADPGAIVIGGVLGAVRTVPGISMSAPTFVQRMYTAGAHGYFDALSYHPYHYTTPFSQGTDPDSPREQVAAIRALMISNGDGARHVWATEYGLPTSSVSEAQQAAYIHDFVASWQNVDGAGPMFVYTARDSDTGSFDDEANFGLFETDWTRKVAAGTVADLITDLADGTAEPFDVTPYLPSQPFLQAVSVFVRQLINQFLAVPKYVLQAINSLAAGVVTLVADFVRSIFTVTSGAAAVAASAQPASAPAVSVPPTESSDSISRNGPATRHDRPAQRHAVSAPIPHRDGAVPPKSARSDAPTESAAESTSANRRGDSPTGHHRSSRTHPRTGSNHR